MPGIKRVSYLFVNKVKTFFCIKDGEEKKLLQVFDVQTGAAVTIDMYAQYETVLLNSSNNNLANYVNNKR